MTRQTRSSKPKGKSALLKIIAGKVDRLYDLLKTSVLARILCSYDLLQGWVEDSFFVELVRKLTVALKKKFGKTPRRESSNEGLNHREVGIFIPASLHKSFKTRLSEAVEDSIIIEKAVAFLRMLLFVPMISYGVFLFAFGLSTTVIQALLFFLRGQSSGAALDLFTGLSLVLLSLPVMFKGYESLLACMKKSVFGSFIIRSMFGIDEGTNEKNGINGVNFMLFVAGAVCGLATFIFPPMQVVSLLVVLFLAVGVIFVPEAGLLLLFTFFPFMGYLSHTSIFCGIAVLYVGVCWLIKLALGKRSFSVELSDALVLALMLMVFISAFAGGQLSSESALLYLAMMAGYLIAANLLRSKQWIKRCSDGLILSSFAVALIGLVQWVSGKTVTSVFGTKLVLGCYLLSIIPLVLARLSAAKGKNEKFRYFIGLLLQCGVIFASSSRLAMLVCIIELVVFGFLSSRKTLPILLVLVLLLPILACLLPLFPNLTASLGRPLSDGRAEAALELFSLIGKAPLTGIGMSDSLLMPALPEDGLSATPELSNTYLRLAVQLGLPGLVLFVLVVLVWIIAGCTLIRSGNAGRRESCYTRGSITTHIGLLIMGCFCYLWSDYRLLMIFWCLSGLYQAVRKYSIEHESRKMDEEVPAHEVQWVNVDLYFDKAGKPIGSEYHLAEPRMGGNEK